MFLESIGVAYDNEAVLGPCDTHINPLAIVDKWAWICAYHRDKNDVELSTLGAVDCKDLIFYLIGSEILSDCVFLGLIRRDHVDVVLCEFHLWDLSNRLIVLELFQKEVFKLVDNFCFGLIFERRAFSVFFSIRHIYEKEGSIRVHKPLLIVGLVATFNLSVIEKGVRDLH